MIKEIIWLQPKSRNKLRCKIVDQGNRQLKRKESHLSPGDVLITFNALPESSEALSGTIRCETGTALGLKSEGGTLCWRKLVSLDLRSGS